METPGIDVSYLISFVIISILVGVGLMEIYSQTLIKPVLLMDHQDEVPSSRTVLCELLKASQVEQEESQAEVIHYHHPQHLSPGQGNLFLVEEEIT